MSNAIMLILTEPAYYLQAPVTIADCQDMLRDAREAGMSDETRAQIAQLIVQFAKKGKQR